MSIFFSAVSFRFWFFFNVIVGAHAIVGCLNLLPLPLPRYCHWCAVLCLVVIYLLQFTGGCRIFTLTDSLGRIFFRVYCGNCSGNIFIFLRKCNSPFRQRRQSRTKREIAAMQASQSRLRMEHANE